MPITYSRRSLSFWLCLILIAGFLITSILSYAVSANAIRSNITDQELPLTGDTVYSEIQKDLIKPTFISAEMANNTFLRDWLLAGERGETRIVSYLREIKEKNDTVSAFLVSDSSGKYYHPEGILKELNEDDSRDAWYYRVKAMEADYETNVDPDLANRDVATVFINYKVFDYKGGFIGATGIGLTLSNIRQTLEKYQQRFNREIYFVDKAGQIVLATDSMHQERSLKDMKGLQGIANQILAGTIAPLSLTYRNPLAGGGDTIMQVNSRYIPELGWYLVLEQDEGEAVKPLRKVLLINLVVSAIATSLVLLLILPTVRAYQQRLEKAANTDSLTGLMNRQAFDLLFGSFLNDTVRNKSTFSMLLFDLDDFKRVNDEHGHLAGDAVIRQTAKLAQDQMRVNDVVARWGGEEFIVLIKDCELQHALTVAEKIRLAIASHVYHFASEAVSVTVSVGVAQHEPPENLSEIFARADAALYEGKQSGRNSVVAAESLATAAPMVLADA